MEVANISFLITKYLEDEESVAGLDQHVYWKVGICGEPLLPKDEIARESLIQLEIVSHWLNQNLRANFESTRPAEWNDSILDLVDYDGLISGRSEQSGRGAALCVSNIRASELQEGRSQKLNGLDGLVFLVSPAGIEKQLNFIISWRTSRMEAQSAPCIPIVLFLCCSNDDEQGSFGQLENFLVHVPAAVAIKADAFNLPGARLESALNFLTFSCVKRPMMRKVLVREALMDDVTWALRSARDLRIRGESIARELQETLDSWAERLQGEAAMAKSITRLTRELEGFAEGRWGRGTGDDPVVVLYKYFERVLREEEPLHRAVFLQEAKRKRSKFQIYTGEEVAASGGQNSSVQGPSHGMSSLNAGPAEGRLQCAPPMAAVMKTHENGFEGDDAQRWEAEMPATPEQAKKKEIDALISENKENSDRFQEWLLNHLN
uniref:Uncharacterized protein n=1 Tax=Chloropicon laureae TaxID=464258 RepID=A0A7S2Z2B8_9CHLO